MIEATMYFGIGFLIAALLGLLFAPLLHNRAVRLTTRRLDAATPLSIIEVRADKDQLRAEFSMSIRRLETSIERMKTKTAYHLVQISRKTEAINELKKELDEKAATILALEARDKTLQAELSDTRRQLDASSLREVERARSNNKVNLTKQLATLGNESRMLAECELEIKRRRDQLNNVGYVKDDPRREIVAARNRGNSVADEMHSKIDRLEVLLSTVVEARSKEDRT